MGFADDWKGIDDTLINSLQQACDFLKLKLECNEEGRQNVVRSCSLCRDIS